MTAMSYMVCILCFISITYLLIVQILKRFRLHLLKKLINSFIGAYAYLEKVFDKEMEAELILKECDLGTNCIKLSGLEPVTFQNSQELRKYFISVGEFIIKYSESIEKIYNCHYETDEYTVCIELLKRLRIICMGKGEDTNVKINI